MAFKSGFVSGDWKSVVIVLLYRTECKNYRGISLLSVIGKIHVGILVESVEYLGV